MWLKVYIAALLAAEKCNQSFILFNCGTGDS